MIAKLRNIETRLALYCLILAIGALFFVAGCAGTQGPAVPGFSGPTCETARATLEEADEMLLILKDDLDKEAVKYWRISRMGAFLFLTLNCGAIR